jgi:prophage antirepressor-like protein
MAAGSSMDIAAHVSKYIFEDGVLKLDGENVKIYYFDDAPEMPWFQAKPIHNFLGAQRIGQTMARVYDDNKSSLKELVEKKGSPNLVGMPDMPTITAENLGYHDGKSYYVNEPGFYQIIFGSDKPEAKAFTNWVTGVVLPTLRRTGTFSVENRPEKRKAEFDIQISALQLAKRICADDMETKVVQLLQESHKNDMLQIVETHKTTVLQIVGPMQTEHKNDMLNLQQLWQKRFEESATQINSFKEWFMKIFCSEIVNQVCFAQSQKFVDLRDAFREAVTNPTGVFVDALRRAVKKPAIKGTSNTLRFPEEQRATVDEERFVVSLSVTLTETLEALDKKRSLLGARHLPTLTYGAWKKCRGLIGIRCLALRKQDAIVSNIVSKPLLWSTSADGGGGRSNGGGQHYVYLKECRSSIGGHAQTYIQKVLKQKFKNRISVEEHLRVLISETIPETWPLSSADIEPTWNEMAKVVADDECE